MKSGFLPAYHMNKNLWISIVLEGLENDGMIKNLIDWSYQVTAARKKEMEID
ncbi:MmcQ/YjbR family DNA-binding protein [Gallintestinimicrobium propionicum]|nr:MmcQ/YjbR family DNA-binding protein [Gallintestinimicrobium propionicum]